MERAEDLTPAGQSDPSARAPRPYLLEPLRPTMGTMDASPAPVLEEAQELSASASVGVDLFWLPLGAGGHFVRTNGRVYEAIQARREHRPPLDLYHTALEVTVPEGRFVIENAWPIPDTDPRARGVTVEGPVWSTHLGRFRTFRYEVRRWSDGTISDVAEAIASPQRVSDDEAPARALLAAAELVPSYVWGRDELRLGEMWNSNSVISWLLTTAGINASEIRPPLGGRAPGWTTGLLVAQGTRQAGSPLGAQGVTITRRD